MKTSYVSSLGLPKGFPVSQYESLKEILTALNGDESKVVDITNKYLRQKGPLVEGRDLLSTYVEEKLAFPMKTKKAKKTIDGKEVEFTMADETEQKHIDRFVDSLVTGATTAPGLTLTGDTDAKETAVWAFLQPIADKFALVVDAKTPERSSKPKSYEKLPKYAREGAENIISKGNEKKWIATFQKENIPFEAFDVKDAPDANKLNLATAIVERESRMAKPAYT